MRVLLHHHALAQVTIDIQRVATDARAVRQREFQFAFQHARIGIAEYDERTHACEESVHLGIHAIRIDGHRLLVRADIHVQHGRTHDRRPWHGRGNWRGNADRGPRRRIARHNVRKGG